MHAGWFVPVIVLTSALSEQSFILPINRDLSHSTYALALLPITPFLLEGATFNVDWYDWYLAKVSANLLVMEFV